MGKNDHKSRNGKALCTVHVLLPKESADSCQNLLGTDVLKQEVANVKQIIMKKVGEG